jgi:hypothetical protein
VDDRLRALERSQDAAGTLRARLQAGELSEATLRLAACCGFAPAALALGLEPTGPPELPPELAHHLQVEALGDWAAAAFVDQEPALWLRGLLGTIAARVLPQRPSDTRANQALEVAREWLACPCPEHAQAADQARFKRSFGHCDDARIVLEGAALIALEIASGSAEAKRAATAIRILTHPIGGDPPSRVRDALSKTLRGEWAPFL